MRAGSDVVESWDYETGKTGPVVVRWDYSGKGALPGHGDVQEAVDHGVDLLRYLQRRELSRANRLAGNELRAGHAKAHEIGNRRGGADVGGRDHACRGRQAGVVSQQEVGERRRAAVLRRLATLDTQLLRDLERVARQATRSGR